LMMRPALQQSSVWLRGAHLRRTSGNRELRFHRERRVRISGARLFLTANQVWRIQRRMASSSRSMARGCRSLGTPRQVRAGDDRRDRGDPARESGDPITGPTRDRSTGGSRNRRLVRLATDRFPVGVDPWRSIVAGDRESSERPRCHWWCSAAFHRRPPSRSEARATGHFGRAISR
jgi:hypothetical protein